MLLCACGPRAQLSLLSSGGRGCRGGSRGGRRNEDGPARIRYKKSIENTVTATGTAATLIAATHGTRSIACPPWNIRALSGCITGEGEGARNNGPTIVVHDRYGDERYNCSGTGE